MSTFKNLLREGIVKKSDQCNFGEGTPDGVWLLHNPDLADNGSLLCVSYEHSVDMLPKLIIDSFINKYERIPTSSDLAEIMSKVMESMSIAIEVGKVP